MEKSKLTKQMRWEIAERLAEERLNQVNMLCNSAKRWYLYAICEKVTGYCDIYNCVSHYITN